MEKDYMYQKIDTSAKDYAMETERIRSERELKRQQETMNQKIDTSAKDYAMEAERIHLERELKRQQEMMNQMNNESDYIESNGRHR